MWQGINKRQFPRANYPCKVVILRKNMKETFSTHTENIGEGGVCVFLPEELPKFCCVEVLIYLKDEGNPLQCDGRIVWSIKKNGVFDIGIEFMDLAEYDRVRVKRVVQECLRK
ncbi:MAG: PilZ domain-containing protein [Candidatus Omnitrophota bacterium]